MSERSAQSDTRSGGNGGGFGNLTHQELQEIIRSKQATKEELDAASAIRKSTDSSEKCQSYGLIDQQQLANVKEAAKVNEARLTYAQADIPLKHMTELKGGIKRSPGQASAFDKIVSSKEGFLAGFAGVRGSGKTMLGCDLIRHWCLELGKRAKYCTAMCFFLEVREAHLFKKSERQVVDDYVAPDLLVVDECQQRGHTDFEDRLLSAMIDQRYGAMKCTILLSNQKPKEFAESMGRSVMSRMQERGCLFICEGTAWPNFRAKG